MAHLWRRVAAWGRCVEAPTWALALLIYGGWLALTYRWHALPLWVAAPLGAWLCAWQMSLQHELIHGHPTRRERVNTALAIAPLNLWLPYLLYRQEHRRHHCDANLTDPLEDPESTYLSADAWRQAGAVRRAVLRAGNTALGRLVLGPPMAMVQFWVRQARQIPRGTAPWGVWLGHAAGVALVLGWVCGVCRIGLFTYLDGVVYPGTALIMIRSLAEHTAAEPVDGRTAVVERAGLLGLLFLNNNLHALHHAWPSLPWYALPERWRQMRHAYVAAPRGPLYCGYWQVLVRFAVRPHHPGPHPFAGRSADPAMGVAGETGA